MLLFLKLSGTKDIYCCTMSIFVKIYLAVKFFFSQLYKSSLGLQLSKTVALKKIVQEHIYMHNHVSLMLRHSVNVGCAFLCFFFLSNNAGELHIISLRRVLLSVDTINLCLDIVIGCSFCIDH
jgi:hypothetical protein